MPARPSSAALHDALIMRRASGLCGNISRHHTTVSSSSSSSGTTVFTSPMSSACCASYSRQRNQISRVFFWPTDRASSPLPNPPSNDPTRGPVWPKRALSAAMVRSQTTWSTWPPPIAYPGDHRDDRLGRAADLDLQVEHVEPADAVVADVAVVAADPLVAARAERQRPLAGEHDHADVPVVARPVEGVLELEEGLGPEGVAHLGPADRDLGDALGEVVPDVAVAGVDGLPRGAGADGPFHGRLHSGSDHSYEQGNLAGPLLDPPTVDGDAGRRNRSRSTPPSATSPPLRSRHRPSPHRTAAERGDDGGTLRFVVQEHHARSLHWDLRLEHDGVLWSWAVPKGIPMLAKPNHLAVRTEDHPLEYLDFQGEIPRGEYGGGSMAVWDAGTYEPEKLRDDEVIVTLHGEKVDGRYVLFRTRGDQWMIHRMSPPQDATRQASAPTTSARCSRCRRRRSRPTTSTGRSR